jgi:mRNA-degrading endonuclease RelE of RelBE toxin-antitoxin system
VNTEYNLEIFSSKVERFIKRLDKETQIRIIKAFDYILKSPFQHDNPTVIKRLHGEREGLFRLITEETYTKH